MMDEAQTESGERVIRIVEHKGLIKGEIRAGMGRDGNSVWVPRYWYPDGRLTPAKPTEHDLILDLAPEPERVPDPDFHDFGGYDGEGLF